MLRFVEKTCSCNSRHAQQHPIEGPGGSETNHGNHRPEQVARKMLRFVEKTRSCNSRHAPVRGQKYWQCLELGALMDK